MSLLWLGGIRSNHLDVVVWDCAQNRRPEHVVPGDSLEKRSGRPLARDACLRWFARVRQTIQDTRGTLRLVGASWCTPRWSLVC